MAQKYDIYALLKNVEFFVKAVPIDPRSPRHDVWVKNRSEVKRAIKLMYKHLSYLEVFKVPALKYPCGKILERQVIARLIPCLKVPIRQPLREPIRQCGKPLPRQPGDITITIPKKP
jgi:hypothetical protein